MVISIIAAVVSFFDIGGLPFDAAWIAVIVVLNSALLLNWKYCSKIGKAHSEAKERRPIRRTQDTRSDV